LVFELGRSDCLFYDGFALRGFGGDDRAQRLHAFKRQMLLNQKLEPRAFDVHAGFQCHRGHVTLLSCLIETA
jgi:hypothetical protein